MPVLQLRAKLEAELAKLPEHLSIAAEVTHSREGVVLEKTQFTPDVEHSESGSCVLGLVFFYGE